MTPRIALLGFSIECNCFAPVATEADFFTRTLLSGQAMLDEARSSAPRMLGELPGFLAVMDAAGPWQPVPILLAMAEPNGPVDQAFFDRLMAQWESGLRDAGKIDGVYCVLHGAGLATQDHDPEGTLLRLVRRLVGDAVPVVATYDLHANVSEDDVALLNAFIGYRTNPHLDMRDGITVVVLSNRYQCADPVFFEAFGLDIAAARVVVVKSRGHFRGGFDEFFRHQDIVEVGAPGLTSPILSRFAWRYMPRPVLPIDDDAPWTATWTPSA